MAREITGPLEGRELRFGIVVSRFNRSVTAPLLAGALEGLAAHGVALGGRWILEVADRQEGRRIGHARPRADERRLEHAGVGPAAGDDDVIRARRIGKLGDDRAEDRVRRHGARQPGQDARERFGLLAPSDLERGDRFAVADRGEPDDEHQADDRPVDRPGTVQRDPHDGDQAENEERDGEDPPRSSDATVRRVRGSRRRAGRLRHVRDRGWRSGALPSIPIGPYSWRLGAVPSYYPVALIAVSGAAASCAAAASFPPPCLTR